VSRLNERVFALDALNAISPDCDRDTWVHIAMAAKSADITLPEFDAWSSRGRSYKKKDVEYVWKSIKDNRGGTITVSTLYKIALDSGWKPPQEWIDEAREIKGSNRDEQNTSKPKPKRTPKRTVRHAPPPAPNHTEMTDKTEEQADDQAEQIEKAQAKLRAILDAAKPASPDHPYLVRKDIPPNGLLEVDHKTVRSILGYTPSAKAGPLAGRLLIAPLHSGDHVTRSMELIDEQGRKWAMAGLPRRGLAWSSFTAPLSDDTPLMGIAEGVATARAAAICANMPVIAAGSYSNMRSVLESWQRHYPITEFVLFADLGGSLAPTQALADEFGIACIPPDPVRVGEGGTDFDDFVRHAGVDAAWEWTQNALDRDLGSLLWSRVKPVEIDYVLPGLPAGTLGLVVGPGAIGKTFLAMEFAIIAALGRSPARLPGFDMGKEGRAALILGEDSRKIINNRMVAYLDTYHVPSTVIDRRVLVRSMDGKDMRILSFGRPGEEPAEMPFLAHLRNICERHRLVIIDPMIRMHDAQENDNNAANKFMLALQRICRATNCAIVLLHHVGKGSKEGWEASRGASAFTTSARWQMLMRPPLDEEIQTLHIENPHVLVNLSNVKANYAPRTGGAVWLRRTENGVLIRHDMPGIATSAMLPKGFGGNSGKPTIFDDADGYMPFI
jgi:hypothetical protein